jgi:acetyl esterase
MSAMTGRTYLVHGRPVTVLAQWGAARPAPSPSWLTWLTPPRPNAPRNVLIRREDGTEVVRPFRGLRKTSGGAS